MAVRYFGKNVGQTEFSIVDSATTNSTDLELYVDLSKLHKGNWEVEQFLDELKNYLVGKTTIIN